MTLPAYSDPTGRPVPRGRVVRTLDYPALSLPLPDWMPAASQGGTQSLTGGLLRVQGSAGQTLGLRTLGVDLNAHEVVAFTVGFSADWYSFLNVGISLKDDAGTFGVSVWQASTGQPTAMLRLFGAGLADQPVQYMLGGTDLIKRRDLTIAVGRADKSVWLLQDDQVVHHGVYPQLRMGLVRGVLDGGISTSLPSGQTRELRVARLTLTVETM
jgi:hypothetical protein